MIRYIFATLFALICIPFLLVVGLIFPVYYGINNLSFLKSLPTEGGGCSALYDFGLNFYDSFESEAFAAISKEETKNFLLKEFPQQEVCPLLLNTIYYPAVENIYKYVNGQENDLKEIKLAKIKSRLGLAVDHFFEEMKKNPKLLKFPMFGMFESMIPKEEIKNNIVGMVPETINYPPEVVDVLKEVREWNGKIKLAMILISFSAIFLLAILGLILFSIRKSLVWIGILLILSGIINMGITFSLPNAKEIMGNEIPPTAAKIAQPLLDYTLSHIKTEILTFNSFFLFGGILLLAIYFFIRWKFENIK